MSHLVGCSLVEFNIPLYGGVVKMYSEVDEYFEVVSEHGITKEDLAVCDGMTTFIPDQEDGFNYIVGIFSKDLDILVHECAHVAIAVADRTGWEITEDTSEPFCYLIADIFAKSIAVMSQEKAVPPLTILN